MAWLNSSTRRGSQSRVFVSGPTMSDGTTHDAEKTSWASLSPTVSFNGVNHHLNAARTGIPAMLTQSSNRQRVRVAAIGGTVLISILLIMASGNSTPSSVATPELVDKLGQSMAAGNETSDLYNEDNVGYVGYAKSVASKLKDEMKEYYDYAASVAGDAAEKAKSWSSWKASDQDDALDSDSDNDEEDSTTGTAEETDADGEAVSTATNSGWCWGSSNRKHSKSKGDTKHNQLSQSIACAAPIRQEMNGTKITPANYNAFQRAFADSWKGVCKNLDQDKFTILMTSSNSRANIVRKNLNTFISGKVPSVAEVYLRWIGPLPTEPLYDSSIPTSVSVRLYENQNGSLNNRWAPIPALKTAYVFSHDDDMEIDPSDFEWAWSIAKRNTPAFTSFVGRKFEWADQARGDKVQVDEKGNKVLQPVYKVGVEGQNYSMGTSASWIHASFMDIYGHDFLKPVRDVVEETQNCEDIAMAFIVPYLTRVPPVIIEGLKSVLHWQFHKNMQSEGAAHWRKRDLCAKAFYKHFGELPPERDYTVVRGLTAGSRKIHFEHVY